MIRDTDMLFLSYLASWQKEKFWCQVGKRVGHNLAAIMNSFLYQIRNSIRSWAIIVMMDLFMILTQLSYKICIQQQKKSTCYHKIQYNHQY